VPLTGELPSEKSTIRGRATHQTGSVPRYKPHGTIHPTTTTSRLDVDRLGERRVDRVAELLEVVDGLLRALGNVLAGDAELLVDSLGRSGGTADDVGQIRSSQRMQSFVTQEGEAYPNVLMPT
jgi:hypothetical protein